MSSRIRLHSSVLVCCTAEEKDNAQIEAEMCMHYDAATFTWLQMFSASNSQAGYGLLTSIAVNCRPGMRRRRQHTRRVEAPVRALQQHPRRPRQRPRRRPRRRRKSLKRRMMTTRRWTPTTSCTPCQGILHACLHPGEPGADEPMLAL